MKIKVTCLVLFLTLFTTSLTYANELNIENKEVGFVASILGNEVVEDAITRQIAFMKAPPITVYTVKKGDNLFRIALNHEVSLSALMEWNNLNSTLIHPGDYLIIKNDENGKKNYKPISVVADASNSVFPIAEPQQTKKVNNNEKRPKESVQRKQTNQPKQPIVVENEPEASKEMTVTATAYTAYCKGCSGTTAYGINLRENPDMKVIAVDPKVIPLGTQVWVEGYGYAIAGDTGGAIKGNKIDVFIPTHDEAMQWGVKKVKIKILE